MIDANRALEIVYDQAIAHPNARPLTRYATAILREAPTIDAVEVVRCRDCVHYKQNPWNDEKDMMCMNWDFWHYTEEKGFCYQGERRKEDAVD